MIVSRVIPALRSGNNVRNLFYLKEKLKAPHANECIRYSGKWHYRENISPNPSCLRRANILGAVTFWWIFWFFFMDYEEFVGVPMKDPNTYTDEELGIPPL